MESHFYFIRVCEGLLHFNISLRPMYVKWSLNDWYFCGEIFSLNLIKALKGFAKSLKCWIFLEKTITLSMIYMNFLLEHSNMTERFSSLGGSWSQHLSQKILSMIPSVSITIWNTLKCFVNELLLCCQWVTYLI